MKSAFRRLTEAEVSEFNDGLEDFNIPNFGETSDIHYLARKNGYQKHFEIHFERLSIGEFVQPAIIGN